MKWLLWKLGLIDLIVINLGNTLGTHKRIVRTRADGTKYCYGYTFSTTYEVKENHKLKWDYTWEEYKGLDLTIKRPEWIRVKPKKQTNYDLLKKHVNKTKRKDLLTEMEEKLDTLEAYIEHEKSKGNIITLKKEYRTHSWMEE